MDSWGSIGSCNGDCEIETHGLTGCYVVVLIFENPGLSKIIMSHFDPQKIKYHVGVLDDLIKGMEMEKVVRAVILPFADYNSIDPKFDPKFYDNTKEKTTLLEKVFSSRNIAYDIKPYGNTQNNTKYEMTGSISVKLIERISFLRINGSEYVKI